MLVNSRGCSWTFPWPIPGQPQICGCSLRTGSWQRPILTAATVAPRARGQCSCGLWQQPPPDPTHFLAGEWQSLRVPPWRWERCPPQPPAFVVWEQQIRLCGNTLKPMLGVRSYSQDPKGHSLLDVIGYELGEKRADKQRNHVFLLMYKGEGERIFQRKNKTIPKLTGF